MDLALWLITLLNGLSIGLLLFMLASGLTLIYSLMGVLNFAHAGFYMLGAYAAYAISGAIGFGAALVLAPLLIAATGALFERQVLRRIHHHGPMAQLLATFGLSYVIAEVVALAFGRSAVPYAAPAWLSGPLFTLAQPADGGLLLLWGAAGGLCAQAKAGVCLQFPALRAFGMGVSLVILAALALWMARSRAGLVIRAALTHPRTVQTLGHDVPRIFTATFAAGCALAALAGVIGGALRVTEPAMAQPVTAIVFAVIVIGGVGSIAGAFAVSIALGLLEAAAVASAYTIGDLKLSQLAAALPFVLLVLMLVLRPHGLFGERDA